MQFTLGKRIPKMGDEGLRNTCVRDSLFKKIHGIFEKVWNHHLFLFIQKKIKNKRQIKHLDFIEYLNRNYI